MSAVLGAQPMHTILLGKDQQFMSGNDESLLGVTLESRLEGKKLLAKAWSLLYFGSK